MDEGMVRAARVYLRGDGKGEKQAAVVVSHWEDEVPWRAEDGVKRFKLEGGEGVAMNFVPGKQYRRWPTVCRPQSFGADISNIVRCTYACREFACVQSRVACRRGG